MSQDKSRRRRVSRLEAAAFCLALAAAIGATFWSVRTTFAISANTEHVSWLTAANGPMPAWILSDVRVLTADGVTIEDFRGALRLNRGIEVAAERISYGPMKISLESTEEGKSVGKLFAPDGRPVEQDLGPSAVLVIGGVEQRSMSGKTVVLYVASQGQLDVGPEPGLPTLPTVPVTRSAKITLLGHALVGRSLYYAGSVEIDTGDYMTVDQACGPGYGDKACPLAYGMILVNEEPGLKAVVRVMGRRAHVERLGSQGYEVSTSLLARLVNDPTIKGLWLTFLVVSGAIGFLRKWRTKLDGNAE